MRVAFSEQNVKTALVLSASIPKDNGVNARERKGEKKCYLLNFLSF